MPRASAAGDRVHISGGDVGRASAEPANAELPRWTWAQATRARRGQSIEHAPGETGVFSFFCNKGIIFILKVSDEFFLPYLFVRYTSSNGSFSSCDQVLVKKTVLFRLDQSVCVYREYFSRSFFSATFRALLLSLYSNVGI